MDREWHQRAGGIGRGRGGDRLPTEWNSQSGRGGPLGRGRGHMGSSSYGQAVSEDSIVKQFRSYQPVLEQLASDVRESYYDVYFQKEMDDVNFLLDLMKDAWSFVDQLESHVSRAEDLCRTIRDKVPFAVAPASIDQTVEDVKDDENENIERAAEGERGGGGAERASSFSASRSLAITEGMVEEGRALKENYPVGTPVGPGRGRMQEEFFGSAVQQPYNYPHPLMMYPYPYPPPYPLPQPLPMYAPSQYESPFWYAPPFPYYGPPAPLRHTTETVGIGAQYFPASEHDQQAEGNTCGSAFRTPSNGGSIRRDLNPATDRSGYNFPSDSRASSGDIGSTTTRMTKSYSKEAPLKNRRLTPNTNARHFAVTTRGGGHRNTTDEARRAQRGSKEPLGKSAKPSSKPIRLQIREDFSKQTMYKLGKKGEAKGEVERERVTWRAAGSSRTLYSDHENETCSDSDGRD